MKSASSGKRKRNDTEVSKPVLVNKCNNYMGGIDRNDAMLWTYSSVRKPHKWRTQLAFHFMEKALLNSFILYNKVVGNERLLISCQSKLLSISLQNLVGIFLSWYLDQEGKPILQKRAICTKNEKHKESRYQCKNCPQNPGFCLALCFELYHTGK